MVAPHTDSQMEEAIINELVLNAIGHSGEIAVSVCDGIVTLTGRVDTYAAKCTAEQAVYDVKGVRVVVSHIELPSVATYTQTDEELARTVLLVLAADVTVPEDKLTITVEQGVVTLRGTVDWLFQRQAANEAVRNLPGVKGLTNLLIARTRHARRGELTLRERIERALVRMAEAEMDHIIVEENDGRIVLKGFVNSNEVRKSAEDAVWLAHGVTAVENRLVVRP